MTRTQISLLIVVYICTAIASKNCPHPHIHVCQCYGKTVDCSGKGVNTTDILNVPADTKVLNLTNTLLKHLPGELFSKLDSLEVLDLFNSSLSNVDMDSFKGLKSLKYLNISKNDNIPLTSNTTNSSLFSDLTQLLELRMYGTTTANLPQQYNYPVEAIGKLVSLETLWLDGMCNRSLGMELSNFTKLRTMRFPGDRVGFGFCNIDVLKDDMFNSVSSITHLYIVDCGIQIIEKKSFESLENLEYLDLSGNICLELDRVSNALKGLRFANLTVLALNHIYDSMKPCGTVVDQNKIEGLQNLTLKELYLEHNSITKVTPNAFKGLPKTLKHVSIKNNEYEPDIDLLYFKELENLETIDASYQFFPNMIWAQPKLETNLQGNNICRQRSFSLNYARTLKKRKRNIYSLKIMKRKRNIYSLNSMKQIKQQNNHNKMTTVDKHKPAIDHVCQQPPKKLPPIAPYLPKYLKTLDVSYSKIDIPVFPFSIGRNNVLQRIYAANSMIVCWEGPVHGLNKLEYLDLRSNMCKRVAPMFFSEFKALKVLLISNNLINADVKNDINGIMMQNLTKLEVLDISSNGLTLMPKNFLYKQTNLQTLNISDNQLEEFIVDIGHMNNLSLLNLSHNALPTLSKKVRDELESIAKSTFKLAGNTLHVDIKSNYIHCYCVNLDFLRWLKNTFESSYHLNITVSHCYYEDSSKKKIRNLQNLNAVIEYLDKACASKLPLTIGVTLGVVVITNILVGVAVYHYRWKLRYWYYVSRNYMSKKKHGNYREQRGPLKYDVHLPYTTEDKASDFVHEIIKNLEEKNGIRICDSDRDFIPGQSDYGMIGNAVHASRLIIFVVSKDFKNDDDRWEIAMRFCEEESKVRRRKVSFCIFIDGIPDGISKHKSLSDIYGFIKANAYLMYPETEPQKVAKFWDDCIKIIRQEDNDQN